MSYGDLPLDAPLKPNKGKEGGACNRRSCQAEPALWFNHGSHAWYCADCARDIGQDWVNKRDWELRWKPECGHDQFETREEIDAREARILTENPPIKHMAPAYTYADYRRPLPSPVKSSSLERLLRKAKR